MPPPPLVADFVTAAERFRPRFRQEALLEAALTVAGLTQEASLDVEAIVAALSNSAPDARAREILTRIEEAYASLSEDEITLMNLHSIEELQHASVRDLGRVCLRALRIAIARVFFELLGNRWKCVHHLNLARRLRPDESVISFNYDLVYDIAARSTLDGADDPWDDAVQRQLYGWSGDNGVVPFRGARILKPHGSINWLGLCRPTRTGEEWSNLLCTGDLYSDLAGNTQPNFQQGWEFVIALPHESTFSTGSDQSNRIGRLRHPFRFLAEESIRSIDRAEICIAIGYSFRDDHDAVGRSMIQRLIDRRIPTIIVGDAELPDRLRARGLAEVHWIASDIAAFVERFRL